MNENLELYKLCRTDDNEYNSVLVEELGWVNDEEFCVWVPYLYLREFMEQLKKIFGSSIFDDGGFNANMQEEGACIDLSDAVGCFANIEDVFSKEKYQH